MRPAVAEAPPAERSSILAEEAIGADLRSALPSRKVGNEYFATIFYGLLSLLLPYSLFAVP
jgi:hypothetical protein